MNIDKENTESESELQPIKEYIDIAYLEQLERTLSKYKNKEQSKSVLLKIELTEALIENAKTRI